ncbi:lysozyme inhibitor LprI family protein [Paraburkholderia phytofirmans]|uniref:lysozyme inhibitor LprI family protein n=1 Tax=Paraburkholderia phytofirmans TaxID=261302 RepID=UPI0038B77A1E
MPGTGLAVQTMLAAIQPERKRAMNRLRNQAIKRRLRCALFAMVMLSSATAFAASFDCGRARLPDEKAICASRQLSEMDVEMAVRYQMLTGLVAMGARGNMQDEQQVWLKSRKACGGHQSCLLDAYRRRIGTLKDEYANLASRGPF